MGGSERESAEGSKEKEGMGAVLRAAVPREEEGAVGRRRI
jgi:hypothetical protein